MKKILFFLLILSSFANAQVGNKYLTKRFNSMAYANGTINDGTTDATASLQRAVDAAQANGGGEVFLPTGIYKTTATITCHTSNVTIVGEGEGSIILAYTDFGDVFKFAPTTSPTTAGAFTGIMFKDIYIKSQVNRTFGYAINTDFTHNALFQNVRIGTMNFTNATHGISIWSGINLDSSSNWVMINCQINAHMYGVHVTGKFQLGIGVSGVGSNYYDGLITGNCNIWGDKNASGFVTGSAALWIDGGTGGIQISQSALSEFAYGIRIRGTNRELFLDNAFYADDMGGAGLWVSDTLNILNISNAWFAGDGVGSQTPNYGVYVDSNVRSMPSYPAHTQIAINGGTVYSNSHGGMYFGAGDVVLSGVRISDNGTAADINIGLNVTSMSITGCKYTKISNTSSITPNVLTAGSMTITPISSSGLSYLQIQNDVGKYFNVGVNYGSTATGSSFGVTNANLNEIVGGGDNMVIGTATSPLYLATNGTRRIYLDATGNMGLNTSPSDLFDLANTGTNPSVISLVNNQAAQYSDIAITNNASKFLSLVSYGSTFSGTTAGITNANLSAIIGSGDNMVMGTTAGTPLYLISGNVARIKVGTTGSIQFPNYGSGIKTGTAAYYAAWDASGNLIETTGSGGGGATPGGTTNNIQTNVSSALYGDAGFTYDPSAGAVTVTKSQNTSTYVNVSNVNTGTSAIAAFALTNSAGAAQIGLTGSGNTSGSGANALYINNSAGGPILFYIGGTTNGPKIDANAQFIIPAGTSSQGKFFMTAGTLLTTPVNQTIEATSTHLYVTLGGTRFQLDQQSGGGGGSPGGSFNQLQYNNAGVFGGSANMTFDGTALSTAGSTSNSTLRVGTGGGIEFQSYGTNNGFITDNLYFNASNFVHRATGYGNNIYFLGSEQQFNFTGTASAAASATMIPVVKFNLNGTVAFGGTSGSGTPGTFTGFSMVVNGTNATTNVPLVLANTLTLPSSSHSSSFTVSSTDVVVYCTAALTCTLPTASSNTNRIVYVKNISSSNITLVGMGSGEFNIMAPQGTIGGSVTLQSNGTAWYGISMGQ